jgi:hypothetical protein
MIDRGRRGVVLAAGSALAAGVMGTTALAAPERKVGYAIVGLGNYGLGIIAPQS